MRIWTLIRIRDWILNYYNRDIIVNVSLSFRKTLKYMVQLLCKSSQVKLLEIYYDATTKNTTRNR